MVKAHFILKQFSYEKGFTDPSSTIYYCKNRFIFLVKLIGGIKIRLKISIFYGEKVVHLADF